MRNVAAVAVVVSAVISGLVAYAQGPPPAAGIAVRPLFDNPAVGVARLLLLPGAREVTHTHPYDFVVVPVVSGRMEVQLAGKTEAKDYAPGDAFFIARNTPHTVANVGKTPFALLGVTIK